MLKRTVSLTSEEYLRTIAIQNSVENSTGQRPTLSQVIGMAINHLKTIQAEAHHDTTATRIENRR
jgi:hypothetical protein